MAALPTPTHTHIHTHFHTHSHTPIICPEGGGGAPWGQAHWTLLPSPAWPSRLWPGPSRLSVWLFCLFSKKPPAQSLAPGPGGNLGELLKSGVSLLGLLLSVETFYFLWPIPMSLCPPV